MGTVFFRVRAPASLARAFDHWISPSDWLLRVRRGTAFLAQAWWLLKVCGLLERSRAWSLSSTHIFFFGGALVAAQATYLLHQIPPRHLRGQRFVK